MKQLIIFLLFTTSLFAQTEEWFLLGFSDNDTIPNSFNFTDQTNLALSTEYTSDSIVVGGIDGDRTTIYAGGASYRKGVYGSWATAYGTVVRGDTIWLKNTSHVNYLNVVNTTLTIGSISNVWSLTTKLPDDSTGYWVATDGNDAWAGNFSYPWLTLNHADTGAIAGSTVNIESGTYVESSGGAQCFTVKKKLRWMGHGTAIVKSISTTYVLDSETAASDTIWFTNIIFDGEAKTTYPIYSNATKNIFSGCSVINNKSAGRLLIQNTTAGGELHMDNCTFTTTGTAAEVLDIRKTATITNSTFNCIGTILLSAETTSPIIFRLNNVTGRFSSQAVYLISNPDLTFSRNTFTLNTGTCASFLNDGALTAGTVRFDSNTITSSYNNSAGYFLADGSTGVKFYLRSNNITLTSTSLAQSIVSIKNCADVEIDSNSIDTRTINASPMVSLTSTGTNMGRCKIIDNTFRHLARTGYTVYVGSETTGAGDGLIDSTVISGNTIYGARYYDSTFASGTVTLHGIFVGFNNRPIIKNNKIFGSGYSIVIKGSLGTNFTGGTVEYNVIANTRIGVYFKGVDSAKIYNNTIYNSHNISFYGIELGENVGGDPADSAMIKNNNIYSKYVESTAAYGIYTDSTSSIALVSDYNNIYMPNETVATFTWANYSNLAAWQAISKDTNGISADPTFTNTYQYDFSLVVGSPCINAGTDLSLTADILGNPISGNPDMGAYEYQP